MLCLLCCLCLLHVLYVISFLLLVSRYSFVCTCRRRYDVLVVGSLLLESRDFRAELLDVLEISSLVVRLLLLDDVVFVSVIFCSDLDDDEEVLDEDSDFEDVVFDEF